MIFIELMKFGIIHVNLLLYSRKAESVYNLIYSQSNQPLEKMLNLAGQALWIHYNHLAQTRQDPKYLSMHCLHKIGYQWPGKLVPWQTTYISHFSNIISAMYNKYSLRLIIQCLHFYLGVPKCCAYFFFYQFVWTKLSFIST